MLCAGWLHLGYMGHWCRWHGQRCSRVATHQGECLRCRKEKKRWWMKIKICSCLIITDANYIAHSIFSFSYPGTFLSLDYDGPKGILFLTGCSFFMWPGEGAFASAYEFGRHSMNPFHRWVIMYEHIQFDNEEAIIILNL